MQYEKDVIVLKEIVQGFSSNKSPIGGIVRIEKENGVSEMFLSIINISHIVDGEYILFILDQNNMLFNFEMQKKPLSIRTVLSEKFSNENGFSAGICFLKDDIPLVIAFATSLNKQNALSQFKKLVADFCYDEYKNHKKQQTQSKTNYNDEAVATENYYQFKEQNNETLQYENGIHDYFKQEDSGENSQEAMGFFNEENCSFCKDSQSKPYYQTVMAELNNIFQKFPQEVVLERCFPDSNWAKISYGDNKYYVVGLIKENKKEKYICYGVPDFFSDHAPKELEGFCSFIPLSVFEMKGKGYWMMFQDAITGECVKQK